MATLDQRFIGMEEMSVDQKGRVGIPARFMNVLRALAPGADGEVGMLLTPDRSIKVMPLPFFNELLERWDSFNPEFEEERLLLNVGPSGAAQALLDKQNRIKLSPMMMKFCQIQPESLVVVSGHMKYMQIYSATVFEQMVQQALPQWGQAASRAAERSREKPVQQFVIEARQTGAPGE